MTKPISVVALMFGERDEWTLADIDAWAQELETEEVITSAFMGAILAKPLEEAFGDRDLRYLGVAHASMGALGSEMTRRGYSLPDEPAIIGGMRRWFELLRMPDTNLSISSNNDDLARMLDVLVTARDKRKQSHLSDDPNLDRAISDLRIVFKLRGLPIDQGTFDA